MRKFYFTKRVVDQWNSLPNWVVTANNTKIFIIIIIFFLFFIRQVVKIPGVKNYKS